MDGNGQSGRQAGNRIANGFLKPQFMLTLVLAMSLFAWLFPSSGGVPTARAACAPPRANDYLTYRFVGSQKTGGSYDWVDGNIAYYNGYIHASSDWNMASVQLADLGNDTWAKAGWLYTGSQRWLIDFYYKPLSGLPAIAFDAPHTGTYFRVQYTGFGQYDMYNPWGSTGNTAVGGGLPNAGFASGETHSLADQMPGAVNNKLAFTNVRIRPFGSAIGPFSGVGYQSAGGYYGLNGTSTSSFEIWDPACAN